MIWHRLYDYLLKEKFRMFDKDRSGDVDTYELSDVFNSIGESYRLSTFFPLN
jgi:Ca2+-binding EF-hand superfamily protein